MQRSHAFDLLCGVCIVRMISLHIMDATQLSSTTWWTEIMQWSFYFMCFFFFKAGYFNKSVSGPSREYCLDRVRRLFVPYVVWGTIGAIIYLGFCAFVLPPNNAIVKNLEWSHVWRDSGFYGNGPVWFLLSFFMMYICVHFIEKVRHLHWIVLLFPLLSWWLCKVDNPLWLNLNNVPMGVTLFYLGRLWHAVLDRLGRSRSLLLSVLMIGGFCWICATQRPYYHMIYNEWTGSWQVALSIMLALCGISGVLLSVNVPRIPVINYIGQHSMVFFVAHYPIIIFYKMLRSAYVRTLRGHVDDVILIALLVTVTCFWLVPYVERVPWLSGRYKRATK